MTVSTVPASMSAISRSTRQCGWCGHRGPLVGGTGSCPQPSSPRSSADVASQCSSIAARARSASPAEDRRHDGVVLVARVRDVERQHRDRREQLVQRRPARGSRPRSASVTRTAWRWRGAAASRPPGAPPGRRPPDLAREAASQARWSAASARPAAACAAPGSTTRRKVSASARSAPVAPAPAPRAPGSRRLVDHDGAPAAPATGRDQPGVAQRARSPRAGSSG